MGRRELQGTLGAVGRREQTTADHAQGVVGRNPLSEEHLSQQGIEVAGRA